MKPTSACRLAVLALVAAGVVAGCVQAPIQEMSDARQALEAARGAGAGSYAPVALDQAEDRLSEAERALRSDRFDAARVDAVAARDGAATARRVALAMRGAQAALDVAQRTGANTTPAREAFDRARSAAGAGESGMALELAAEARREAESAVNTHQLEKSRSLLARVQPYVASLASAERARYEEAQAALTAGDGRRAYELARTFEGYRPPVAARRDKHSRAAQTGRDR